MSRGLSRQQVAILLAMRQREQQGHVTSAPHLVTALGLRHYPGYVSVSRALHSLERRGYVRPVGYRRFEAYHQDRAQHGLGRGGQGWKGWATRYHRWPAPRSHRKTPGARSPGQSVL